MFRFTRPSAAAIAGQIQAARRLPDSAPRFLSMGDDAPTQVPRSFAHDRSRSVLGSGPRVFAEAKAAFAKWAQFDLCWVRVANPEARIEVGEIVAVEVRSLGLWTLNLSRIVATLDKPNQFGFIYATTEMHVEDGEERFLLRVEATGEVFYELEAVSRPRSLLARIGYPVTRHFQHRFARDSHRRTLESVASLIPN